MHQSVSVYTLDIGLFIGLCDGEKISTLRLTGSKSLTPGEDRVQVKLVTGLQLWTTLPEFSAA